MAKVADIGSPESSDDDSVSLTSTVSSMKLDHYPVEEILAEKEEDGEMVYLTKWEGYPESRNTWEPEDNFDQDSSFHYWQERKMRITRGLDRPFDVEAWERRVRKMEVDTRVRRKRRQRKKNRLNQQVDTISSEDESDSVPKPAKRPRKSENSPSTTPSRHGSIAAHKAKWTDPETRALDKGLQDAKGPIWNEIFGWYGKRGTINRVLKDKCLVDLQEKVQDLKQEFIDAGKDPPIYMNPISRGPQVQPPRTSKPRSGGQSRAAPKEKSPSSDSETSADSMMEELRAKTRGQEVSPYLKKNTKKELPQSKEPRKKEESNPKKTPSKNTTKLPEATKSRPPSPQQSPVRGEQPPKAWSGTARDPTKAPPRPSPTQSRMGARGRGPARLSISKSKSSESRKASTAGINTTTKSKSEPKIRTSKTDRTKITSATTNAPPKQFKNLAMQNAFRKRSRNEPAPDPAQLVFIGKDGKATRGLPVPPTPKPPVQVLETPFQKYRKELAAKEAAERQGREHEEVVDTTKPKTSEHHIQRNEISVDKQEVTNSKSPKSKGTPSIAEKSATASADPMNHPQRVPDKASEGVAPLPPPSAPLGPKAGTNRPSTIGLKDYTKGSADLQPLPTYSALANRSPPTPSQGFHLRANPMQEERKDLSKLYDQSVIYGHLKIGPDDETIKVKFLGLGWNNRNLLLTIKIMPNTMHFEFKRACVASEYQAFFHAEISDYLGSGFISPYAETEAALENLAQRLAVNLMGGLFFAPRFTMIMYPVGASAWAFLDNELPPVPEGAIMRFVIRQPLPQDLDDGEYSMSTRLANEKPDHYAEIKEKIQANPIQTGDKNINVVFRDMFGIDYHRLIARNDIQNTKPPANTFFLCFIPQGIEDYEKDDPAKRMAIRLQTSKEHDCFVEFLEANGAEEIYSMQGIGSLEVENNGAWDYFRHNVKSGAIVFHDACIRHDQVPSLAKFLLNGNINVWKMSFQPMHEAEKHPHLVRLFPHGGVILLTQSLILYRPCEALRILMWFRSVFLPSKPAGTWKIATRPRIREWLLNILDVYTDTPGSDVFGCGMHVFGDIYTEIWRLLQKNDLGEDGLKCHLWDYELPTEEAPIVCSSRLSALQNRKEWKGEGFEAEIEHENIRLNDELLVQWFAEWATCFLDNFRKFNAILGYPPNHDYGSQFARTCEKSWGHIEVFTVEDCYSRHQVTLQARLNEMEGERLRKQQEQIRSLKAENKVAIAEERQSAKESLESIMQTYRDAGCSEKWVLREGRRFLKRIGSTKKEKHECKVDIDRVIVRNQFSEGTHIEPVHGNDPIVDKDKSDRESWDWDTDQEDQAGNPGVDDRLGEGDCERLGGGTGADAEENWGMGPTKQRLKEWRLSRTLAANTASGEPDDGSGAMEVDD